MRFVLNLLESRPGLVGENRLIELMSIGPKRKWVWQSIGSERFAVYWFLGGIDPDFDVCR